MAAVTNASAAINTSANNITENQSTNNPAGGLDMSMNQIGKDIFTVEEVFDEEKILNSEIYQQQAKLLEDPKLEGNEMHRKLVHRLTAFYLNQEKIKVNGLTESQKNNLKKSGFSMDYRIKLHKSLRTKILQIVSEKD